MSLLCEVNQNLNIYIKRIFFIRLVVMVLVFTLKINDWTKIILILLMDYVKTLPLLLCNTYPTLSTNSMYQELDKILDSLGYVMCYQIIVSKHLLPPKSTKILFAVLSYRLVGLSLFFLTFNRSLLFFFPDLFKEIMIVLYFVPSTSAKFYIFSGIILVLKLYIEYLYHIKKVKPISKKFLNLFSSSENTFQGIDDV
jgi:hypothetical protein